MSRFTASESKFTVTEDHLKLLRRMYVSWDGCEFGAPAIDCKRPYGNSSVYHDIGQILGIKPESGDVDDPEFSDEQVQQMDRIHRQMKSVLQIMVDHGELKTGEYVL